MINRLSTLSQTHSKNIEIPILLGAAALLLVLGLFVPAITLKELIFWKSTFSVISGIISLFQEKHYLLGFLIFLFSIIFPLFKLGVMFLVWYKQMAESQRKFYLHWLGILGKWSMLDVFVVAITIVITKISKFAKAEAELGIYLFCASIVLAMLASERMERLLAKDTEENLFTLPA